MASRLSVGDVRYALKASDGLVTYAAKFLGVGPKTLAKFIDEHQELKVTINEAKESLVDTAELKLRERVEAGSEQSILFTLRTLGKDRGYGETKESPLSGLKVVLPKDFPADGPS